MFITATRDSQEMVIREVKLEHSHDEVSQAIKASYPESRRLPPDVKAEAPNMLAMGVKVEHLRRYLSEQSGKVLTRKDVHNIRTLHKHVGPNEEETLLCELESILNNDPTSTIHVKTSDDNHLEAVFIQTSSMKILAERYCEVVEIDTTYKLNDRRMPLVSVLVEDRSRSSQVIEQCIVQTETEDNIRFFVECLGCDASAVMEKLKCLVVDKDFTLLSVIQKTLPKVHVILCAFHVAKTFRKETAVMQVSTDVREKVQKELLTLKDLAPAKFYDYFIKNWDTVKSTWVRYIVNATGNLGNHTTNRIEAYHSAIKHVLPAEQSFDARPKCSALSDDEGSMQP